MLNSLLLGSIKPSNQANNVRLRAPICEQFARQIEEQTFSDHRTGFNFSFKDFSTSIKKFGCAGVTHLNNKHITACFSDVDSSNLKEDMKQLRAIYFKETNTDDEIDSQMRSEQDHQQNIQEQLISVQYLLKLSMLLCTHLSQQDQLNEMWLLVNPMLDEIVQQEQLLQLVATFTEIAVKKTQKRLLHFEPQEPVKRAMQKLSLQYLEKADAMTPIFLEQFRQTLPQQLSFEDFCEIVVSTCMNSCQLRMKITNLKQATTSKDLTTSQVSTIVISYLSIQEQILKGQLVCRKWYKQFIPQVVNRFPLGSQLWQKRNFRIIYEEVGSEGPLYLALINDYKTDVRELCGRTFYVSAGSTQNYKDFSWTIDTEGAIVASDGSGACLAAHRTYINDCVGQDGTFVISTVYKGHENNWRLERVGDLDRQRYLVVLGNSKCVKDKIDQIGWAITARIPLVSTGKAVVRDETSRYVYTAKTQLQTSNSTSSENGQTVPLPTQKLPIWRLEHIQD